MKYLTMLDGVVTGVYDTKEEADLAIPVIVKTSKEWNQCPYCGAWFFDRKKRFCTAGCRVRWWKKVENDHVKAETPYCMAKGENR